MFFHSTQLFQHDKLQRKCCSYVLLQRLCMCKNEQLCKAHTTWAVEHHYPYLVLWYSSYGFYGHIHQAYKTPTKTQIHIFFKQQLIEIKQIWDRFSDFTTLIDMNASVDRGGLLLDLASMLQAVEPADVSSPAVSWVTPSAGDRTARVRVLAARRYPTGPRFGSDQVLLSAARPRKALLTFFHESLCSCLMGWYVSGVR